MKKDKTIGFTELFLLIISISLVFSATGIYFANNSGFAPTSQSDIPSPVIVLDAGHGGEDGGASIYGDIPEKELNLLIARKLRDMLRFCGINVVMTRDEDTLLYDKNSDYQGKKKSQDLAKRLEITRSLPDAILISIHMNAFPEQKYKGLQVYFSPHDEESYTLANMIQNNTRESLMTENTRKVKKADSKIYLLDRYEGVGILVECGFMSNPEEYERLCSERYRKELSFVMLGSVCEFLDEYAR